jgi:hypothetical protein
MASCVGDMAATIVAARAASPTTREGERGGGKKAVEATVSLSSGRASSYRELPIRRAC